MTRMMNLSYAAVLVLGLGLVQSAFAQIPPRLTAPDAQISLNTIDGLDLPACNFWFELDWVDQAIENGYRIERFDNATQQWVLLRDMGRNAEHFVFDVSGNFDNEGAIWGLSFERIRIRAFTVSLGRRTYGPATEFSLYEW